ncbi:uncharacterized protein si:ch211-189a15.5 [Danio rerio]|uniref:Uncharacterized protein si:ch211-189a15.5 n=1 Tax=Danio rerio TaxID=7955 RepID=A0ACD6B7N2_DANRE|nr:uncharacterized protein si:ch211-189a15.5 [Danio rerio]|eukprot:XP_021327689.1 uncharacterized protein si:ch211-189a15.5 [Danio rerio]
MTNSVEDPSSVSRKDAFAQYLQYYEKVCGEGGVKACPETQVTDEDRLALLFSDAEPRKSLHTGDFYERLFTCAQQRDGQRRVNDFRRALELLEMFCVNLFLFPWKKEIKTLKTFTGHFVYYIKPVLPFARSILHLIGYTETDSEYRLSDSFDLDKARTMGFDLFLARLECDYLLELMNQKSHVECLEIMQKRATQDVVEDLAGVEGAKPEAAEPEGDLVENPEELQPQESLKSHDQEVDKSQEDAVSDEERPPKSFETDDKSILEMWKAYPDLAFRQNPIFRKSQRSMQPLKAQEWAGSRGHNAGLFHETSTEMSGPQSIAIHTETSPGHLKPHNPNSIVETQPLDAKPIVLKVGALLQGEVLTEDGLSELTEQMGKMQMKELSVDEPLKYPTEETAQAHPCNGHNDITTPPTKSPDCMSPPILCSSSQEPVCNISGCGSCARSDGTLAQEDTIREPPQSIYIPCVPKGCAPVFGSPTDHCQTANEGSSAQRSPTSQPAEDDLVQTYVIV